jgi:hypothetical protein
MPAGAKLAAAEVAAAAPDLVHSVQARARRKEALGLAGSGAVSPTFDAQLQNNIERIEAAVHLPSAPWPAHPWRFTRAAENRMRAINVVAEQSASLSAEQRAAVAKAAQAAAAWTAGSPVTQPQDPPSATTAAGAALAPVQVAASSPAVVHSVQARARRKEMLPGAEGAPAAAAAQPVPVAEPAPYVPTLCRLFTSLYRSKTSAWACGRHSLWLRKRAGLWCQTDRTSAVWSSGGWRDGNWTAPGWHKK